MLSLSRLFAPRRRKNQEDVAGRATEVIAKVLSDIGIDRFLNGSLLLDHQFRPRFFAVLPTATHEFVATVAVRDLAEAHALRAYVHDAALDAATAACHARLVSAGLMRQMLACSPELRALPARRVAELEPA